MDLRNPKVKRIDRYQDTHLIVDFERQTVQLDGVLAPLTHKEFDLLGFLIEHSGELLPRATLLALVWGYTSTGVRTRTLDVHVRRLRRKLGRYGATYIETVFGVGYRFQPYRARALAEMAASAAESAIGVGPATAIWDWPIEENAPN